MLQVFTGTAGLAIVVVVAELLRRRQLREKYALLWLITGLLVIPAALFPSAFDRVATTLGVASGVSLVLFVAIVFLLLVTIHLSWELSSLEEETRTLAEEIALLKTAVEAQSAAADSPAIIEARSAQE